jgi:twitching motility protein PilT
MLHASQRDVLARRGHLDFAWSAPSGRARVSAYHAQRGVDAVLRLVPARTPSLDELGLPRAVARLVGTRSGLILCTGPRGSGKSTTLAALLGATIASRAAHVITIEDPIEHLFEPSRAFVIQREVGTHTGSFARALHAALREDPDILFVSELRDAETTALAITAAETGHLVLAALPVTGTSAAVQHVVGSFPAEERDQMRARLTDSLRAVVDQRLLPRASGTGRAPAVEVAILTPALRNLIRQDRLAQWHSGLQAGRGDGMVTLDESVAELLRAGTVTAEAASRFTHRRERVGGG